MSEITSAAEQGSASAPDHGNIMNHIQEMIGGILKNTVDKMHTEEHNKKLGGTHKGVKQQEGLAEDMSISDVKNFVSVMQKFIDNVNIMISQIESGSKDSGSTDDKFLEGYMATADNVLEIAAFSMKDPLTGLSNRYGFENRLILEWNRATRDKSTLGLVIFGVDNFDDCCESDKRDEMFKGIADGLESTVKRSTDFIARWCEDEFAVLLPMTDVKGVTIVAERILTEFGNLNIPCMSDNGCKTQVSIGVCTHGPDIADKPVDYINKAHDAYEKAKKTTGSTIVYV